ncbi:hypothetical protein, partial [Clostridium minihomine]|uniref:hypothetical protein n=1 Tax=Clostridium minihomine TaxID=2045012 RepID=UPI001A91EA61
CKYSNVFSLAVLIGRGLDHNFLVRALLIRFNFCFFFIQFLVPAQGTKRLAKGCERNGCQKAV